jgi:hypothetical protein
MLVWIMKGESLSSGSGRLQWVLTLENSCAGSWQRQEEGICSQGEVSMYFYSIFWRALNISDGRETDNTFASCFIGFRVYLPF